MPTRVSFNIQRCIINEVVFYVEVVTITRQGAQRRVDHSLNDRILITNGESLIPLDRALFITVRADVMAVHAGEGANRRFNAKLNETNLRCLLRDLVINYELLNHHLHDINLVRSMGFPHELGDQLSCSGFEGGCWHLDSGREPVGLLFHFLRSLTSHLSFCTTDDLAAYAGSGCVV